jgi:hypothetical protein
LAKSSSSILSQNSAINYFNQLCGTQLSEPEEKILFLKFSTYLPLLQRKKLTADGAKKLLQQIRITLKSQTIAKIVLTKGFLFDGIIGAGGGKALLYRVFQPATGAVFCGKVYLNLFKQPGVFSTHGEFQTSLQVHGDDPHPNIVEISQAIEFSHESTSSKPGLLALILPLYPMSLADIIEAFGQTVLPYDFFRCIAHGLLSAGAREKVISL